MKADISRKLPVLWSRLGKSLAGWPEGVWLAILATAAVLALAPAVLLLPGTLPMADEFCLAKSMRPGNDLLDVAREVYVGWSGRMLSHVLIALPTWLVQVQGADFVTTLVGLNAAWLGLGVLAVAGAWALVGLRGWRLALLTLAGVAWLLWHMPSPRDAWFWYSAVVTYSAVAPLLVAGVAGVWLALRGQLVWAVSWAPVAAVALLAMSSLNELAAVLGVALTGWALVGAWAGVFGKIANTRQAVLLGLLGVAMIGLVVTLVAPGNAVRMGVSTAPMPLPVALAGGVPLGLGWLLEEINLALLIWWLAVATLARRWQGPAAEPNWRVGAWLGLPLVGLAVLAPAIGLVANGESLPNRAENMLLWWLWWGGSLLAGWAAIRWPKVWAHKQHHRWALAMLAVVLVATPDWVRAVNDTRRVEAHRAAYAVREATFYAARQVGTVAEVAPLGLVPKTLYEEGLQAHPEAWQNACVAVWYGLPQGVRLMP